MILSRYKKLTGGFVGLSILYLALTILLPPDKASLAKYHITVGQDILLTLTIAIPVIGIWIIALIGYLRFKSYTETILKGKDGNSFKVMAQGIFLLSVWLPLSSILGSLTSGYYRAHPSSTPEMVYLNNYLNLIILFLAFWIFYQGTSKLLGVIKKPVPRLPQPLMMLYISFSALYLLLVLHDPARQFPTQHVAVAAYYLPDWLTVITLVIPRLISWHFGMQAVYNLFLYRKGVKGPIYKNALNDLANGLSWIVITVIVLRCFESISSQLTRLSLGVILLVIYLLLVLISVGYVLISRGAKKLQMIEEV